MKYLNDNSIIAYLKEIDSNHKILDNVLMAIDDDVLLLNVGARGFRLDDRIKTHSYTICKRKSVADICNLYDIGLISMDEAVIEIKKKIQELESEVKAV